MSHAPASLVRADADHVVGDVDPRIFSGFLEHLGRAVYGGVYEPGHPLSDARGFRRDVLEALRAVNMPLVRYPGGNFVSAYDWRDGIGPRERRPVRRDYAWQSLETNQFGTDEFMAWCAEAATAPLLAVNLGTARAKEAGELLEYVNLPTGSHWSDLRAAHGRAQPYGVKHWCLGNEMDGPWQAGHCSAAEYAQRAREAALLMKGLDRSVEFAVCGSALRVMPTYLAWDRTVLEACWDEVSLISAHHYAHKKDPATRWGGPATQRAKDSAWFLAEGVEIDRVIEDYAGLIAYVRGLKRSEKRVHVSFDEWNVWHRRASEHGGWTAAPALCEETYTLEDALVVLQYLNSFVRHADTVKVACLAQIVNVIAPLTVGPRGVLRQTTYYPWQRVSRLAAGRSLRPVVHAPDYDAGERGHVPVLDAAVTHEARAGEAAVILLNRAPDAPETVRVELSGLRVTGVRSVEEMGGGGAAALALANTWDTPDAVTPRAGRAELGADGRVSVRVPAPGFTLLRLAVEGSAA